MVEFLTGVHMKYIGIVGSRCRNNEEDFQIVKKKLLAIFLVGDVLVSGGCKKEEINLLNN